MQAHIPPLSNCKDTGEELSSVHNNKHNKHTHATRVQNTTSYTVYSDATTHIKQHHSKGVQPNGSPCANNYCDTRYEQSFRHNKHTHTNQKTATDQDSRHNVVVVNPLPWPLLVGGGELIFQIVVHQPVSPSIWQQCSYSGGVCPQIQGWHVVRMWVQLRDNVCRVYECYRGGRVVMDVICCRLCVNMIWGRVIYLFLVGQECDKWGGVVYLQSC